MRSFISAAGPSSGDTKPQVRKIIGSLDQEGRRQSTCRGEGLAGQPGFKPGQVYMAGEVLSRNVETLREYLMAAAGK